MMTELMTYAYSALLSLGMAVPPGLSIPPVEFRTFEQMAPCVKCVGWYVSPNTPGTIKSEVPTIWLREDVDPDTVYGKSVIVHEIVHYMQDAVGAVEPDMGCERKAEVESQALNVQGRFLEANGDFQYTAIIWQIRSALSKMCASFKEERVGLDPEARGVTGLLPDARGVTGVTM